MPFPHEEIDCKGDPAGRREDHVELRLRAGRRRSTRQLLLLLLGPRRGAAALLRGHRSKAVKLAHRIEPEYLDDSGGDIFRSEKRKNAFGVEVDAPFDARGIMLMSYRYKSTDKPRDEAKNDDTWVYVPTLRRVRRISTAQRTDAISGTDFTFDDLRSFAGIVPQYEWECLGEIDR